MKKILSLLLLIGISACLKAQQLIQVKPDAQLNNSFQNFFKPDSGLSPKSLLLNGYNNGVKAVTAVPFHSNMPIVKLTSADNMPIVVPGEPGMKYTMLIKKLDATAAVATVPKPAP